MSCKEYYDLKLLESSRLPIDDLIQTKASRNLISESRIWKKMYDVTPDLIDAYEREGKEHIHQIREEGYLYFIAKHSNQWFNAPHFDYAQFPLMSHREGVLQRIKKIARSFAKEHTVEYDATCLYLLYFFALIINPTLNWTTIDYLSNGNRYHPYGTRLKGKIQTTVTNVWV